MRIESALSASVAPPRGRRLIVIEEALEWFWGRGGAVFQRSTFGDQLERASMFAGARRPCFDCGGIPESLYGGEVGGSGFTEDGDQCRRCRGIGWVVCDARQVSGRVTARPRPEPRKEAGYEPEHRELTRFAIVSRVVSRVALARPILARALEAYYGDQGSRWGRTEYGRILSVYPLTSCGARLVEQSRRRSSEFLTDAETIGVEAMLQRQQPNDLRRALLGRADMEARRLHLDALVTANRLWGL